MAGILDEFLLIFKAQVKGTGFEKIKTQMQNVQTQMKNVNTQMKQNKVQMFQMRDVFKGFFAYDLYNGIKQFGQSLIETSKDLGAMEARFYAITHSEQKAGEELQWVFDLAQRTAMPLKKTADAYSIFYSATQKSIGTSGARQVFQDWSEVGRVLHLSSYQFERITYALREMASKGAIYSQDLRMQIGTHVPNAMGLAQKAVADLGITGNDWFEKFQTQAKGNQQLINQFIVLFSKYAKEQFADADALAKAMKKPDSALNAFVNTWQLFQIGITKSGFSDDLVSIMGTLNWGLAKATKHLGVLYGLLKNTIILLSTGLIANALAKPVSNFAVLSKEKGSFGAIGQMGKMWGRTAKINMGRMFGGFGMLLTNPVGQVIAVILAIGALVAVALPWFKKKFPNAWNKITEIISILWKIASPLSWMVTAIKEIGNRLGWFTGEQTQDYKSASSAIEAEKQNRRLTGGFWGNTEYGGFWDVLARENALNRAKKYINKVSANDKLTKEQKTTYYTGLQVVLDNPTSMTPEMIDDYIRRNPIKVNNSLVDIVKNHFKGKT